MTNNNILLVDARDLDRLTHNLKAYQLASGLSENEILNKKGNDFRIQLFKGFWKVRWKTAKKGGASLLLKRLTRAGKGILVRLWSLNSKWASEIPDKDKNGKPLSDYQKLVMQEVLCRASGVGILGVSFLRKRWRYTKEGAYLTSNRTNTFGISATFEKTAHAFTVTGFTPGLGKIAQKYGILTWAMNRVSVDMEPYLARKLGPEFSKIVFA